VSPPLKTWLEHDGTLLRLRLNRPKANIIDAEMIAALDAGLERYREIADLRGVILDAEGSHFSFGASVEEHLPDQCADMLHAIHGLILKMLAYPVPILVAVQGQCLGGGLELALAGHLLFVAHDARLGQPEIKVGVFAPAASCLLPERAPRAVAEALLYSGVPMVGDEAVHHGVANVAADDPAEAAVEWFDANLAGVSAVVLRHAVAAARLGYAARIAARLAEVEELYLNGLMNTRDAVEGLHAFLEKRPAKWMNS
jgi:cyclohexa-1,5-dienecarbonyl-CoA hydratase